MKDQNLVTWHRRPYRSGEDSLGSPCNKDVRLNIVCHEFKFFVRSPGDGIVADILEPHRFRLGDDLIKLTGLSRYAAIHGHAYRRIEAVAKIGDDFKVPNLTNAAVPSELSNVPSTEALYRGPLAQNYVR